MKSLSKYLHFRVPFCKNKFVEMGFQQDSEFSGFWLHTSCSATTKCDHAGVNWSFSFGPWMIEFHLYDWRHWNYEENRWRTKEDIEADRNRLPVDDDSKQDRKDAHIEALEKEMSYSQKALMHLNKLKKL